MEPAGPHQVDQRAHGRQRQLPAAPACGRPDAALGEPARRQRGSRHAADVRRDARPATPARFRSSPTCTARSASATRATATPRRGTCPPRTTSRPDFATEGTWYDFFAGKAAAGYGATWGPGFATFQYPNAQPRVDDLVPRPRARDDAAERVRGPGRLLPDPGRPGRRRAGLAHRAGGEPARAGAARERQVPAQQALPGDRDRDPGPLLQRPTARCSIPTRASSSTRSRAPTSRTASSRRSGTPSSSGT